MHSNTDGSDSVEFKNRKRRLIVAGILQSGTGLLSALSLPFVLLGLLFASDLTGKQGDLPQMAMFVVLQLFSAAWYITLGLGSIACKRWARDLSLAGYWISFIYGISVGASVVFYLPAVFQYALQVDNMPENMAFFMTKGIMVFMFATTILFPLLMLLLYSGKHVKATCQYYNPKQSWTARRPFPVLLMSMVFVFMAGGSIYILGISSFRYPFFGMVLSGAPAIMVGIGVSLVCTLIGYGVYKLKMIAWIGAIAMITIYCISMLLSSMFIELEQAYRFIGISNSGTEYINFELLPPRGAFIACVLVWELVLFCYLAYARRFFVLKPQFDVRIEENHEEAGCQ